MMAEPAVVIVASPILGYVIDLSPHRTPYYWAGLLALTGATIMLTTAYSVQTFIAGRLIQGIASSMLDIVGRAIVVDAVPIGGMGHYAGYVGAFETLGFAIGPVAGGPLYYASGYYAVMGLAFALITIDMILRMIMIEKNRADEYRFSDLEGGTNPLHTQPDQGYNTMNANASSEATLAVPGGMARWHALKILREPRFLVSIWATTVHGLVYSAFDTVSVPSKS